jgi:hypothetical protein
MFGVQGRPFVVLRVETGRVGGGELADNTGIVKGLADLTDLSCIPSKAAGGGVVCCALRSPKNNPQFAAMQSPSTPRDSPALRMRSLICASSKPSHQWACSSRNAVKSCDAKCRAMLMTATENAPFVKWKCHHVDLPNLAIP